ncbi:MAG: hypothetical protein WCD37_14800 [Chloroflexia bacterium]
MSYIFKGRLCGYICEECPEPLSGVKVRLYRSRADQNLTQLAVAHPKDTFAPLSDEQVKNKEDSLLAEVEAGDDGSFAFELGEKEGYEGEAFEIDFYCGSVPRQKIGPKPPRPRQFTITMLQPMWRETQYGYLWGWEYCLPARIWCAIRALFGAWAICGRVMICDKKAPVGGVKVSAFDADWITDDLLGTATTDAQGKFRIDYGWADFHNTFFSPIINWETPFPPFDSGPDVYFQIEDAGGGPLLTETRSDGHKPGRENVGACLCIELCVDTVQPPFPYPWFTHVGDFDIYADIDATTGKSNKAAPASLPGSHGGPNFGFYDGPNRLGLKLRGFCPKLSPFNGQPMRYRFLYEHPATGKLPITGWNLLTPVVVGSRLIQWDPYGTGMQWTLQSIVIAGSGATPDPTPLPGFAPPWGAPPAHVIVPDADGWVSVDQNALDGGFYGPLIRFRSEGAVPLPAGGTAPGSGAGNAPADPKNGVVIKIYFEAGPVGGPITGNNLDHILINNWMEVSQLDIAQFLAPGANCCSPLSDELGILYTADHELMRSWSVGMSSCADQLVPGWSVPALPSGTTPRGGHGRDDHDISDPNAWPSCSYTVKLSTTRAVTDGETDDSSKTIQVTFCK